MAFIVFNFTTIDNHITFRKNAKTKRKTTSVIEKTVEEVTNKL